eukprot:s883_g8.t1
MECMQSYNPDLTLEDVIRARNSKDPAQTELYNGITTMRKVKDGEEEVPYLNPKSDVAATSSYSVQIYRKVGLITEEKLLDLTGATGKILGLEPLGFRLDGPTQPKTYLHIISLCGVPSDVAAGMLKMKVVHDCHVDHAESVLRAEDQILQEQGVNMWNATVSRWNDSFRPLKISASSVLSLQDLLKKAEAADAQASAAAAAEESQSEDEAEEGPPGARRGIKKFSIGTTEPTSKTKKTAKSKVKGSGKGGRGAKAALPAQSVKEKDRRGASPSPSARGSMSQSKTGRVTKADRLHQEAEALLAHDEEMLKVARRSLSTDRGSGIKSLASLVVKDIFEDGSRPSNALTAAKRILKNFQSPENKSECKGEALLLATRINECEAASTVLDAVPHIGKVSYDDMMKALQATQDCWQHIPPASKGKIAQIHVAHLLKELFEDSEDEGRTVVVHQVVEAIIPVASGENGFDGQNPTMCAAVEELKYGINANFDEHQLDDESEDMKGHKVAAKAGLSGKRMLNVDFNTNVC